MQVKWLKSPDDLRDAFGIREEVFIREQKFIEEFDEIDTKAWHIVLYDTGTPVATGRIFEDAGYPGGWRLGRIAVLRAYRGQRLGALLLREMEIKSRALGGSFAILGAQCRAKGFYEKSGYTACSEPYYEEYCEHILMRKPLENPETIG